MNRKIKRIGLKAVVIAFILALTSNALPALAKGNVVQDPEKFGDWEVVGPSGGDVRVVTIDPRDKNRLYISTLDGQIHTSSNGGKSWKLLVNLNKPGLILDQLQVDIRNSKILYTSGHRYKAPGGFFKSTDGGITWKESKELRSESIHSMVQSSNDPNTIVLGTFGSVWFSKDSGDSWTKVALPMAPDKAVDSLAIDPNNVGTMYAGTWWRAYKTTDSGKNWRLIKDGMIDDSDVFAVSIDPRNSDHIIASACSGIYESINAGEKWAKIQGIPSQSRRTRDIVQHPSVPGTIYAATTEGFWMSTSGGKSWILTTQRDLEINSIAVHPDDPNRIFIGTNNYGIMVSNDGGRNFVPTNDNFTSRLTYTIKSDVERSNRVYATTLNTQAGGGYFFYSDNSGNSWQQARGLDINRIRPYSVLQDRANPNNMYLGTNAGIFRSVDRGVSWTLITASKVPARKAPAKRAAPRPAAKTTGTVKRTVSTAAVTPPPPKTVRALTEKVKVLTFTDDGRNGLLAGTDKGLYRSYDLTRGWERLSLGIGISDNIFVVSTSSAQPGTIWVGTEKSGVIVSRDDGKTWSKTNGAPVGVPVSSIALDPKRPDHVYVGTAQALYLSRDGGTTWDRRGGNLPLGNFTSILINPENTDEIFVSSSLESDGGIYYSEDAGMKWKRVDSKEMKLPSRRVWSMAFDPHDPRRIFAGSHSSGVYRIVRRSETGAADTSSRP